MKRSSVAVPRACEFALALTFLALAAWPAEAEAAPNLRPYQPSAWPAPLVAHNVPAGLGPPATDTLLAGPTYFSFAYENVGNAPAGPSKTYLYVDDAYVWTCISEGLSNGYYEWCSDMGPLDIPEGSHTYRMVVDAESTVSESTEGDNALQYASTWHVSAAGPKTGSGVGQLGDAKPHIDTFYDQGYFGYYSNYVLVDMVRRANLNPHGHNGQMSAGATIITLTDGLIAASVVHDIDNVWNAASQKPAVDAHVSTAKVYDYLLGQFSLNSFDNAGTGIASVVDVDCYSGNPCCGALNAFWYDGAMFYCTNPIGGAPQYSAALDVIGHELGHAVTEKSSWRGTSLTYARESGALNEAFSDWLGTSVEHAYGETNWTMGEGVQTIRDLSNPSLYSQPDTYLGADWYSLVGCVPANTNDYCGVHTNSGVPNKMFYLLAQGGLFNGVAVDGLGIATAMRIAMDANRNWWTKDTTFLDARAGMVAAAAAYGDAAKTSVRNAWAAVQVGAPAPAQLCGDATGDQKITSADALAALRAAVGSSICSTTACDYDGDGKVSAPDALAILRVAVGQSIAPNCPTSVAALTTTSTELATTTLQIPSTTTLSTTSTTAETPP